MKWAIGGAALALVLCAWGLSHGYRELQDARQGREAAELTLKNQIVAKEESAKSLNADKEVLISQNAELRSALQEAQRASPGAQTSGAATLRTATVVVPVGPEMPPTCGAGQILAPDGSGHFKCAQAAAKPTGVVPPPPPDISAACVLSSGDSAWFRVDLIELTTREKNTLITGTAELWKSGTPSLKLLGPERFQAALSKTSDLAEATPPRWGVEVDGLCQRAGCGLGASVLFPPVVVLGVRLEARAGALLGPDAAAIGALGLRF